MFGAMVKRFEWDWCQSVHYLRMTPRKVTRTVTGEHHHHGNRSVWKGHFDFFQAVWGTGGGW